MIVKLLYQKFTQVAVSQVYLRRFPWLQFLVSGGIFTQGCVAEEALSTW
jgi:hypothetical protein